MKTMKEKLDALLLELQTMSPEELARQLAIAEESLDENMYRVPSEFSYCEEFSYKYNYDSSIFEGYIANKKNCFVYKGSNSENSLVAEKEETYTIAA